MTKRSRVEKQPEEAWRSVALAAKRSVAEAVIRSLKTNQAQWNAMTLSDGTERVHKLDATNAEVAAAIAGGIQLPPDCELRAFDRFVVESVASGRRPAEATATGCSAARGGSACSGYRCLQAKRSFVHFTPAITRESSAMLSAVLFVDSSMLFLSSSMLFLSPSMLVVIVVISAFTVVSCDEVVHAPVMSETITAESIRLGTCMTSRYIILEIRPIHAENRCVM